MIVACRAQVRERAAGVRHAKHARAGRDLDRSVHDHGGRLRQPRHAIVAVHALPADGDEDVAGLHLPVAVGHPAHAHVGPGD